MTNLAEKLITEKPIREMSLSDIRAIKDDKVRQAVFHIKQFYAGEYGNLLFSCNMSYRYAKDINTITVDEVKELMTYKNLHLSQALCKGIDRSYKGAFSNSGIILDIDFYKVSEFKGMKAQEIIGLMRADNCFDLIEPSYFYSSGEGLNIVYLLKPINANTETSNELLNESNQANIDKRRAVIRALHTIFEKYNPDDRATDLVRYNKVPGSFNVSKGKKVEIIGFDKLINSKEIKRRTLGHLYNFLKKKGLISDLKPVQSNRKENESNYINKEEIKPMPASKPNERLREFKEHRYRVGIVSYRQNELTLNEALVEDYQWLASHRKGTGFREYLIFLYAQALKRLEIEDFAAKLSDFNKLFDTQLPYGEIQSQINSFMNSGKIYFHRNTTIIKNLSITPEEMKSLKVLIDNNEKSERHKDQKKQARRNENGLTSRENTKLENIKAIAQMLDSGCKQKEISEVLGLSKSTVSEYVKEIKALEK